jgi:integrase
VPCNPHPARLWLRPPAKDRAAIWVIVDRRRQYSTGCSADARREAEEKLQEYLAAKHNPAAQRARRPAEVPLADVLSVYLDEMVPKQAQPAKVAARIGRLLDWWGDKRLGEVTPVTCREYLTYRIKVRQATRKKYAERSSKVGEVRAETGGSRRDLEDLRAAINHHARRGLHVGYVGIDLPEKGAPRATWLTRSEVAHLLWACWRHGRKVRLPRGRERGKVIESEWHDLRHIARFILIGVYTGSRSNAIFSASIHAGSNRSFVDLDSGLFYRLAEGASETNKRQPPVRLPLRLLAHLRRWRDKGIIAHYVVEWDGMPVQSVKVGWKRAVALSGIEKKISPHTLRHTAATWLMQNGVDKWEAAGFLGMSETMVERVYGHHHPDFQTKAADLIARKRAR